MDSLSLYAGKPTLYLDHNILDFFVKNGIEGLGRELSDNYQIVYSNETLKEISRSSGFESDFLNVLENLGSYYLEIIIEPSRFVATDKIMLSNRNAFEVFEEYKSNMEIEFHKMENSMIQWLLKYSGGRVGDSLTEIYNEQIDAFTDLMKLMRKCANELPDEIRYQIFICAELMQNEFESTLHKLDKRITTESTDYRNWNGIRSLRESLNINPKKLNNITPPNVILKIFDLLVSESQEKINSISIEDFFQISEKSPNSDRHYSRYENITRMYNMLNSIGYFPDSSMNKEKRLIASMSDNSHAAHASFCNELLSADVNFVKKAQAIYEYLCIETKVTLVTINYK